MQKTIIKAWLVVLLVGVSPSYAQSRQVNTPQEKPWYVKETFISTVASGFVIALVGYAGGMIIGGSKKVSEADKQTFENRILEKVTIIVDTKIQSNEKIKGLESQLILQEIKNSIEDLTKEIHNMNRNHEAHKESVVRRFDEVHKGLNNQQRNSEKVIERVNQALQSAFGEYGVSVPTIQVRRRDSNPYNYDIQSDEGNIE